MKHWNMWWKDNGYYKVAGEEAKYSEAEEEKERLQKARAEIEKQMKAKKSQVKDTAKTLERNLAEQNMMR